MIQVNMLEAKSDLSRLVKLLESKQEEVIYLARIEDMFGGEI